MWVIQLGFIHMLIFHMWVFILWIVREGLLRLGFERFMTMKENPFRFKRVN